MSKSEGNQHPELSHLPDTIRAIFGLPGTSKDLTTELHELNKNIGGLQALLVDFNERADSVTIELHKLNEHIGDLQPALVDLANLQEVLGDFREMAAPLLGWRVL